MIVCAYNRLQSATWHALSQTPIETKFVRLLFDHEYAEVLSAMWRGGRTFVNVEQDVVPWPGAIMSLLQCDHPWCNYAYGTDEHSTCIGCTKFSDEMLAATASIWEEHPDRPHISWNGLDQYIAAEAQRVGLQVHMHHPGVVNANPTQLPAGRMFASFDPAEAINASEVGK